MDAQDTPVPAGATVSGEAEDMTDETREAYEEINALVGMIAQAHGIDGKLAAAELENGDMVIEMGEDELGERFISACRNGVEARIYQGVIQYAPGVTPPVGDVAAAGSVPAGSVPDGSVPAGESAAADSCDDSGKAGGCGCGA